MANHYKLENMRDVSHHVLEEGSIEIKLTRVLCGCENFICNRQEFVYSSGA